ncbi:MAG: diphosphomevalonate decarboxylase [Pseudomonadota bacterium]
MHGVCTAQAHANIALVKYWGKRSPDELNLPAAGSISLTVDRLITTTTVRFACANGKKGDALAGGGRNQDHNRDSFFLDGAEQHGERLAKIRRFLDLVRARAGLDTPATVESTNSFPTASGLASSASAFAALALAASSAAGLRLSSAELSVLARRGSGSAARSVLGGFVEMLKGERADGTDARATQLLSEDAWDVRLVVAIVGHGGTKDTPSTQGMRHTAMTSPLFEGWLASVATDLDAARQAIHRRQLSVLGEIAERSALTMHASALAARPGIVYFRGATIEAVHAVRLLRRGGVEAYFTVDAGPHVKVLCEPGAASKVVETLGAIPGVGRVLECRPGGGVRLLDESNTSTNTSTKNGPVGSA